jgi:hypothetical protein
MKDGRWVRGGGCCSGAALALRRSARVRRAWVFSRRREPGTGSTSSQVADRSRRNGAFPARYSDDEAQPTTRTDSEDPADAGGESQARAPG